MDDAIRRDYTHLPSTGHLSAIRMPPVRQNQTILKVLESRPRPDVLTRGKKERRGPMDPMDRRIFETAFGCILTLGCWKASKENWFVAFIGLAFLAWAFKFAESIRSPFSFLVYAGAFGVMLTVSPLWEYMKALLIRSLFRSYLSTVRSTRQNARKG